MSVNEGIEKYFRIMLDWMAEFKPGPFTIVETGTQRDTRFEGHEDGLSTYIFSRWIRSSGQGHKFVSIDLASDHQSKCQKFLEEQGVDGYVKFELGDGAKVLEAFGAPIDFAYLDAGASATETLEQFMQVLKWRCEPTLIVIDDQFDKRNASKGLLAMPIARQMGFQTASLMNRMGLISLGVEMASLAVEFPREANFVLEPSLDPKSWQ